MVLTSRLTHAVPANQPVSVQQIADILFPAYAVVGGRVSLAGCALEDRLLVQLRFRHQQQTMEIYLQADGKEVGGEPIMGPRSVELSEVSEPPASLGPEIERLIASGTRLAEGRVPSGDTPELIAATAIWCKYVDGKLRFTIGASSVDLPFSGWTQGLTPPPLVCPHTGTPTFCVMATDDGRIAAAEQIEECAETGRRMLATELVACCVTGHRVAPELIEICPISGRRLLRTEMVECGTCRQRVSPAVVERNQCAACRKLRRVSKADPRMARVFHEHPTLDRWRYWRMAETARAYVLVASGWLKRLLVVVDKDSLELKTVATGSRLLTRWDPAEPEQYPYILRE